MTDHSSYRYYKWKHEAVGSSSCNLCKHGYHDTNNIILESHHIWSMAEYPELSYDPNNHITLCNSCHKLVHKQMRLGTIKEEDLMSLKDEHHKASFNIFLKHQELLNKGKYPLTYSKGDLK